MRQKIETNKSYNQFWFHFNRPIEFLAIIDNEKHEISHYSIRTLCYLNAITAHQTKYYPSKKRMPDDAKHAFFYSTSFHIGLYVVLRDIDLTQR